MGDRRAPWARAARGGVSVSLSSTLPALKPWAEAKVQGARARGRRRPRSPPSPPIAVVDLVPGAAPPAGALSGDVKTSPRPAKKRGPFETEFGAFIYDKGYRQLFRALGYPGADAEAALALGASRCGARSRARRRRAASRWTCLAGRGS